jgi:membrane protein required for colicin V production
MNIVDAAILVVLLLVSIVGVAKGFIRELSSIIAWVLAGIASLWDIPMLQTFMRAHFDSAFVADIIAGVFVCVIAFTIVSLIGTICSGFIRGTVISPLDRFLGAVLCVAKWIFLISCLEISVNFFISRDEMHSEVKQSVLAKVIYDLSDWILSVLPNDLKQFLDELSYRKIIDITNDATTTKETVKNLGTLSTKVIDNVADGVYTNEQKDQLNKVLEFQKKQNDEPEEDAN